MALGIDNGRRVLLFERHCWALKDLNDRAKLAFFNAMLDYGSSGVTEFGDAAGIVRTLMPEIVALSETSWKKANNRRTKTEHARNKRGTNAEQNPPKEEEEEKDSKESSTVRVTAHRQPTLDEVYSQAETLNWLQYAPGWTMDQLRACLAETHAELTAHGWQDGSGRPVKNWRAFFCKVVSEKKICAARAEVSGVPVYRFNPEAM